MDNFKNCGYYIDDECTICGMGTDGEDTFCKYCKDNPNCYYKQFVELKAENERLKEEIETRDNLIDHFRDEALYRATIASEYQKDKTKLEQTLQEIKAIAESCITKDACYECKYSDDCYIEDAEIPTYDICKLLIQKITKAEEE